LRVRFHDAPPAPGDVVSVMVGVVLAAADVVLVAADVVLVAADVVREATDVLLALELPLLPELDLLLEHPEIPATRIAIPATATVS
jgi:hypothetical protein